MGGTLKSLREKNNVTRLTLESFPPAPDCEINCRAAREKWERPTKRPSQESRSDEGGLDRAGNTELLEASAPGCVFVGGARELSLGLTAGCERKKVKMTPSISGLSVWVNDVAISEMGMPREEGLGPASGEGMGVVYTC